MTVVARRLGGYRHELSMRDHKLTVDEPLEIGGEDTGPQPTELLAASLASCTAVTIEMYADHKGWRLDDVEVAVDYELGRETSRFQVTLRLPKDLSEEQTAKLQAIAAKCPVHRALAGEVEIEDRVEPV